MEKLIALALTTLVGAFIGSFLGSYLKKKGENLATHEDLDKLLEQVRAVTTTTKEIEAKISTDVWDRQRRWELKRDVLFSATKGIAAIEDSLVDLNVAHFTEGERQQKVGPTSLKLKSQAVQKWGEEATKFDEVRMLVGIVCGKEVTDACNAFGMFARRIAIKIGENDAEIYDKSEKEFVAKSIAAATAIRKELEMDKTI